MGTKTTWISPPPKQCDLCRAAIRTVFVDGRMHRATTWAIMCIDCHAVHGVGLGTGKGQEYARQADGRFVKTKG